MTLPDERYRSLVHTQEFLKNLVDPGITRGIPKEIRSHALHLLRHWPTTYDLELMTERMPDMFAKEMEPLYRMIKLYQKEKNE